MWTRSHVLQPPSISPIATTQRPLAMKRSCISFPVSMVDSFAIPRFRLNISPVSVSHRWLSTKDPPVSSSTNSPPPSSSTPHAELYPQSRSISIWLFLCCLIVLFIFFLGSTTRFTRSGLSMVEWKFHGEGALPSTDEEWQVFNFYLFLF